MAQRSIVRSSTAQCPTAPSLLAQRSFPAQGLAAPSLQCGCSPVGVRPTRRLRAPLSNANDDTEVHSSSFDERCVLALMIQRGAPRSVPR